MTLRGIQLEYYNLLNEMVESGRYDRRDDFTVVVQPHQRDIKPILDVSKTTVAALCNAHVFVIPPKI